MKFHPAVLMLMVWSISVVLFFVLPFQLQARAMSLYGLMILLVFIAVYCFGAAAASGRLAQQPIPLDVAIDFRMTDRILVIATSIALIASVIDVQGRDLFDLVDSYQVRSDRAGGLLNATVSESSFWFQIAFLTSPAGYILLVREIAFRPRPILWRAALLGFGPIVMVSLAAGGRNPLFYALLSAGFAYLLRKHIFRVGLSGAKVFAKAGKQRPIFRLNAATGTMIGVLVAGLGAYFVSVFVVRANAVGGVDAMFGIASLSWGVNFNGQLAEVFFKVLGPDVTYLVFVFGWYIVQGLVISNTIFTSYDGPMMWSAYGIDLSSAIARRANSEFLANGFSHLLGLNVLGFLPSAFGSLFVDFKFLGLIPCFIWGWLSGLAYKKIKQANDPRWLLAAPIVINGILLSLMNTPLGFSNGLVTHLWLVVAFMSARIVKWRPPTAFEAMADR